MMGECKPRETFRVGLLGLGTVGTGVFRILERERERIRARTGRSIEVVGICVRDPHRQRTISAPKQMLYDDPEALLAQCPVDAVVEVMGGEKPALPVMARALRSGLSVITANKLAVARHYQYLHELESSHGGTLHYGAAVCGSIPILKIIDETFASEAILKVRGIVNGSSNFVLTRMEDGADRDTALAEARRLGLLEADSSADLSGADAACKLSIMAAHAFGVHVAPESIPTEGVCDVSERHVRTAREAGRRIRLIAEASMLDGEAVLRVSPQWLEASDSLAAIREEVNAVEISGTHVGRQCYVGCGAGSLPTASAVVSDLLEAVDRRAYRRRRSAVQTDTKYTLC